MNQTLVFKKTISDESFTCRAFTDAFGSEEFRRSMPVALVLRATLRDAEAFLGRQRLAALLEKLQKKAPKLGGVCVGLALGDAAGSAYFYCADINAADAIENAPRGGLALIEGSAFSDPEWKIYQTDVLPTAAELQTIENAKLLGQYEKRGDDPLIMRRVNHHLSFADEVSLTGFALDAKNAGFALSDSHYNGDMPRPNGIFVHNIMSINSQSMDVCTTTLVELAQKYSGAYDYWDCPIMKKQKL